MTARVVLVCGPAGAGKTTHARALERDGYARLSFDDVAWDLGHRDHPLATAIAAAVHDVLRAELLRLVADGRDVVVDTSFWSRASRDAYRRVLAPTGCAVVVHHLDTPREVVLERLARRRHTGGDDVVVPHALAVAYLDGFEPPTPDEGPVVLVPGSDHEQD